eukprot:gene12023-5422_t
MTETKNLIQKICQNYNLEEQKIHAIYQYGSTVYGRTDKHSDIDIMIVYQTDKHENFEDEKNNFSIEILSPKEFKKTIIDHEVCVLTKLFLPKKFILKESSELENFRKNFIIDLKCLERESVSRCVTLELASRDKFKENKRLSLKKLVHSMRTVLFALQIAKEGLIYDYQCGNKFYDELFDNMNSEIWKDYSSYYFELFVPLKKELTDLVSQKKESKYKEYKKPKCSLVTIDVIKDHGWRSLIYFFSIQIRKRNGFNILENVEKFANFQHLIHRECTFLALNLDLKVIGCDVNYAYSYDDSRHGKINWKSCITLKHYNDYCFLFFDRNEWNFYCQDKTFDFWNIFKKSNIDEELLIREYCYKFGIKNEEIFLVGIRNTKTMEEINIKNIKYFKTEISFHNEINEIFDLLIKPNQDENGYLLVDDKFNRILFPYPLIRFTKNLDLKTYESTQNEVCLLEIARYHELENEIVYNHLKKFPSEILNFYLKIETQLKDLCEFLDHEFKKIYEKLDNIKEISKICKTKKYVGFYILMYKLNSSQSKIIFKTQVHIKKLMEVYSSF